MPQIVATTIASPARVPVQAVVLLGEFELLGHLHGGSTAPVTPIDKTSHNRRARCSAA
jgi:hypothetical protein